jgi:16S rRNA (cytosine967-C5)-methyltransferase
VLVRLRSGGDHIDLSYCGLPELRALAPRDRGLAFELVTGTIKHRNSLDAVLDHFSRVSVKRAPGPERAALRLGAFQLLYLDRVPAHAAVGESVALVGAGGAASKGYVNAVLRKVASTGAEVLVSLSAGDTTAALALRHSHPEWIVKLLVNEFGRAAAENLLAAANQPGERCLRINPGVPVAEVLASLSRDGVAAQAATFVDGAFRYEGAPLQASQAFAAGWVTPQSQGSQLVGRVAVDGARTATSVADLCAAPGTKTAQIALALPQARVLALDNHAARCAEMRVNLARQQVTNVEVVVGDALEPQADGERRFDLVLVDAPCTGLGTLASRADLRWRRKPADVARLAKLQTALLRRAGDLVADGGCVTYAVCTMTRAETLAVVDAVLGDGGWQLDDLGRQWPAAADPRRGGCLLTLPSRHNTSGFFIARLRRTQTSE